MIDPRPCECLLAMLIKVQSVALVAVASGALKNLCLVGQRICIMGDNELIKYSERPFLKHERNTVICAPMPTSARERMPANVRPDIPAPQIAIRGAMYDLPRQYV